MRNQRRMVLAVLLALAVLLPSAGLPSAGARTIAVGPAQAVKTLDVAHAMAAAGDVIELERGVEHPTRGLKIEKGRLTIRSAAGSGPSATIVHASTTRWLPTIEDRSEGLKLVDLIITGRPEEAAIIARGKNLSIERCTGRAGDFRWLQLRGGDDTRVVDCDVPLVESYAICNFDADARGLVIERCTFAGSTNSHTIRLQDGIYGLRLRDSMIGPGKGDRSALNIKDGGDCLVERTAIDGPIGIGPLADGNGGIKLPATTPAEIAKRETMLGKRLDGITFRDCTIATNGIMLEMGAINVVFSGGTIRTTSARVFTVEDNDYRTWRPAATGLLEHVAISGPSNVKLFYVDRGTVQIGAGVTLNGVPVPPTVPTPEPEPEPEPAPESAELAKLRLELAIANARLIEIKTTSDALAQLNAELSAQVERFEAWRDKMQQTAGEAP